MSYHRFAACLFVLLLGFAASPALAQMQSPTGTPEQRAALDRLAFLDGEWRGTATINSPQGRQTLTQTERVGPMLGGSIRVIEGRGYAADGSTAFNAMAIVSWDAQRGAYGFRSYAQGYQGDYPFEVTEDGFRWQTPAGPGATIQYVATVRDGRWREVGSYVREGQPPVPYIELDLRRVGDSDWPAGGAVAPGE
jgi:hypothetical protein